MNNSVTQTQVIPVGKYRLVWSGKRVAMFSIFACFFLFSLECCCVHYMSHGNGMTTTLNYRWGPKKASLAESYLIIIL